MNKFNPYKMFSGAFIPNWLLKRPDVSMGAKLTAGRLMQYSGKDGECYPTLRTLADEIGCSSSSVSKWIKELIACKVLSTARHNGKKSNSYHFLEHEWMEGWLSTVPIQTIADAQHTDVSSILREKSGEGQKVFAYFFMKYKDTQGKPYLRTKIDGNLLKTLSNTYSYEECQELIDYFFTLNNEEWWINKHGYGVYSFYKLKDKIIKEMHDETSKDRDFTLI